MRQLLNWLSSTTLIVSMGTATAPGCYAPQLSDCTVACVAADQCADGQVCGSDGFCTVPENAGTCTQREMAAQPDAPLSACEAACPGMCDGDTCIINCTASGSCQSDVICPAGLPCRVACGDNACLRVRCDLASSCDITCSGKSSCTERITCGAGRCDVACTGSHACRQGVDCHAACACDVMCLGEMSCRTGATCPSTACDMGSGCTAADACDQCE